MQDRGKETEPETAGGDGWRRLPPELWLRVFALGRKAWDEAAYVETLWAARLSCGFLAGLLLPELVSIACLDFGRWEEALGGRDPVDETDEAWGRLIKEAEERYDAWDGTYEQWGPLLRALMTVPSSTPRGERATRLLKRRMHEATLETRVRDDDFLRIQRPIPDNVVRCLEIGRIDLLAEAMGPGTVDFDVFGDWPARSLSGPLPEASSAFLRRVLARRISKERVSALYQLAEMPDAVVTALDPREFIRGMNEEQRAALVESDASLANMAPAMVATCWGRADLFEEAWDRWVPRDERRRGVVPAFRNCVLGIFGVPGRRPRTAALDRWPERLYDSERRRVEAAIESDRLLGPDSQASAALCWYESAFPRAAEAWRGLRRESRRSAHFVKSHARCLEMGDPNATPGSPRRSGMPMGHPALVSELKNARDVLRDDVEYLEGPWKHLLAEALDSGDVGLVSLVLDTIPDDPTDDPEEDPMSEFDWESRELLCRIPERHWNPNALRRLRPYACDAVIKIFRRWECTEDRPDGREWDPSTPSLRTWASIARDTDTLETFLEALRREGVQFPSPGDPAPDSSARSIEASRLVESLLVSSPVARLDILLWALNDAAPPPDEHWSSVAGRVDVIEVLGHRIDTQEREKAIATCLAALERPELADVREATKHRLEAALERRLRCANPRHLDDEMFWLGIFKVEEEESLSVVVRLSAEFAGRGWMDAVTHSDLLFARFADRNAFRALRAASKRGDPFRPFRSASSTKIGLIRRTSSDEFGVGDDDCAFDVRLLSWICRRVFPGSKGLAEEVLIKWLRRTPRATASCLPAASRLVTPAVLREWRALCAMDPRLAFGFFHPRIAAVDPEGQRAWLESDAGRPVKAWMMQRPEWFSYTLRATPFSSAKRPLPDASGRGGKRRTSAREEENE